MNNKPLLPVAMAMIIFCCMEVPTLATQGKDPPPPIYIGPTPKAAPPAPTQPSTAAIATPAPPPSAPAQSGSNNIEKLVMPIALHPDPLIAIILPASAYPLEIVQAARFVKDTNNIPKVDAQPWDDAVKAVAKFPDLIAKLDADLPWTIALGQAFIDQPTEVINTIQALRGKAHKAGTLQSSAQQVVTVTNVVVVQTNLTEVVAVTNQIVQVQPSNPQVVYVPSYPPTVYYPPPAYVYDPFAPLVTFSVGMMWGAAISHYHCDWHHGEVDVDIDQDISIDRPDRPDRPDRGQSGNRASNTGAGPSQQKWQPDQSRLNKSGAPSTMQSRDARGWGGAQAGQRPAGGGGGARPSTQPSVGAGGARPSAQPSGPGQRPGASARPTPSTGGARPPTAQPSVNRSSPSAGGGARSSPSASNRSGSSAFSGMSSGGSARSSSSRGSFSRGGGGGFRGGGGRR